MDVLLERTALGEQEIGKLLNRLDLRLAIERATVTFLCDQADTNQTLDMVGERRGRYVQIFLDRTDRQPVPACLDE